MTAAKGPSTQPRLLQDWFLWSLARMLVLPTACQPHSRQGGCWCLCRGLPNRTTYCSCVVAVAAFPFSCIASSYIVRRGCQRPGSQGAVGGREGGRHQKQVAA
ncbi:hypothetical protein E2C01_091475 [Portunus trituberculatus]|uniref:Secreted protein n=1 Tax=Portunus trituberculatus TaxID=210409 RepID=A0A5B7JHL8_PORTR|nr:hypothetical protein [Portunus trituberculatus]